MNLEELRQIKVLHDVDSDSLGQLAAGLVAKTYADGEAIFSEGDPGDSMYFLAAGCVQIAKRAQAAGAAHKILTVLEPGDYFGEMALLDQKPRSASAISSGPTRVLRLSKATFDQLQSKSPITSMSVLFAMIRTSSDRIRRLSAQLVVYDEVGKAIGDSRDLQSLLDVILEQLCGATHADWGLLLLRSQFSDRLDVCGLAGLTLTAGQREAVESGQGFLAAVLQSPCDHLVECFEETEAFKSCARIGFETPSLLVSTIIVQGRLLGVLVLGGSGKDQFDLDALNLSRGVARQAGQAILNARHREEEQARSRHARQYVRF